MAQTPRAVADAAVAIGQVFLGKYRVDSVLGHGGMGVVAKCTHLGLNEHVAIKMLRQDVLMDRDATERFMREAQSASKLKSEHVARVVDVGAFETGVPYMVMEFLDGHDLGDLVEERGALQAPFAAMLMLQAAEALAEAHSIGIVHRDVKPSNLFVTWRPDGSALVKVLDFGISKAPSGNDMKLTQTQSLLGTPAYMSPEQMRSARLVDARTDIWSLGTVFYELLEGRRPFEAESFSEMCVKVAVDPPTPMVNTPPALQAIILRCLAKNPDQRYATMAEFGRDLLPHVQDVHQASLLVERMQRVLGRASRSSSGDWDGPSTGVGRTPILVLDPGSASHQQPWHPGSEPFGAPIGTPSPFSQHERTSDPRAPSATVREASAPVVQARGLSEVVSVPQVAKKSKGPLILFVALTVLGIGIGAVVAMNMGDGKKTEVTETPAPKPAAQLNVEATPPDPKSNVGGSQAAVPDDKTPKTADGTKPDTTKPDTTKPDTTKPDTTKPDTTKPDTTKPDDTKPEPDDTKPTQDKRTAAEKLAASKIAAKVAADRQRAAKLAADKQRVADKIAADKLAAEKAAAQTKTAPPKPTCPLDARLPSGGCPNK